MAVAVSGIDFNRLPDETTQAALIDALQENLVLYIRDQHLAPEPFRDEAQVDLSQSQSHGADRGDERTESDKLLDTLIAHAVQPEFQY